MKLTRSGRTVTKPAKFATSGMAEKANVVATMVDNKVNVVERVDGNVGVVVDKDGKTRDILQASQAKSSFLIPVENEKATYIVRLPEKTEVESSQLSQNINLTSRLIVCLQIFLQRRRLISRDQQAGSCFQDQER